MNDSRRFPLNHLFVKLALATTAALLVAACISEACGCYGGGEVAMDLTDHLETAESQFVGTYAGVIEDLDVVEGDLGGLQHPCVQAGNDFQIVFETGEDDWTCWGDEDEHGADATVDCSDAVAASRSVVGEFDAGDGIMRPVTGDVRLTSFKMGLELMIYLNLEYDSPFSLEAFSVVPEWMALEDESMEKIEWSKEHASENEEEIEWETCVLQLSLQ